jgi:hypothetical protein
LSRYGNNSERALDWLLNVGEEAAAAAAGVAYHDATSSSAHRGGDFPSPKRSPFLVSWIHLFYLRPVQELLEEAAPQRALRLQIQ